MSAESLRDELARLLYEAIADTCGGYVESVPEDERTAELLSYTVVDGPINLGYLADVAIERMGRPDV